MTIRMRRITWLLLGMGALLLLAACQPSTGDEPGLDQTEAEPAPAVEEPTIAPTAEPAVDTATEQEVEEEEVEHVTAEPTEPAEDTESSEPLVTEDGTTIFTVDDRPDRLRAITSRWNTNWNRHTIDYGEILSGGPPRDGIPSIDNPQFVSQDEAAEWLAGNEPVIAVEIDGEARAYPLQILTWHEIVNDTIGDTPVTVTFCPLCNSAIVFDRRLDDEVLDFGTSGLLRNSDLVMYDRTTESLWQQFTGEAIVGNMVGKQLTFLPSSIVSFDDFGQAYPDGVVLSRDTGFSRPYGQNPYAGYDTIGNNPFLFTGEVDGRLPAMERVVAVSLDGADVAYPFSILSEAGVINDTQAGQELVVFHMSGTSSALGAAQIAEAEDIGATGVFDPNLDGRKLTFRKEGDQIVDEETGSTWNILGQAIDGPLAGEELAPIVHGDHFWFSWAAFKPDTIIYQEGGD